MFLNDFVNLLIFKSQNITYLCFDAPLVRRLDKRVKERLLFSAELTVKTITIYQYYFLSILKLNKGEFIYCSL